jgi:hypothetical protein
MSFIQKPGDMFKINYKPEILVTSHSYESQSLWNVEKMMPSGNKTSYQSFQMQN